MALAQNSRRTMFIRRIINYCVVIPFSENHAISMWTRTLAVDDELVFKKASRKNTPARVSALARALKKLSKNGDSQPAPFD